MTTKTAKETSKQLVNHSVYDSVIGLVGKLDIHNSCRTRFDPHIWIQTDRKLYDRKLYDPNLRESFKFLTAAALKNVLSFLIISKRSVVVILQFMFNKLNYFEICMVKGQSK